MDYLIVDNLTDWPSNISREVLHWQNISANTQSNTSENVTKYCEEYLQKTLQDGLEIAREIEIRRLYGDHYREILVVDFITCIIGLITNVLNVVVFSKLSMSNTTNLFLFLLSIADIVIIATQVLHVAHYYSGFRMYPYFSWVVFFIVITFFENIFVYVSNWLVATVGVWRCVAITWPFQIRELCTQYRAKLIITIIFIMSVLLSTPILYLNTYETFEHPCETFYGLFFSDVAQVHNSMFLKVFWGLQQLKGLVPMIIMVVTTVWMITALYKIRRERIEVLQVDDSSKRNQRITLMLTILLFLYWLSNIPDCFMFLLHVSADGNEELQHEYRKYTDILRIFSLANISLSFFIYYVLVEEFRRRFHQIFGFSESYMNKYSKNIRDSKTVLDAPFEMSRTSTSSLKKQTHSPRNC